MISCLGTGGGEITAAGPPREGAKYRTSSGIAEAEVSSKEFVVSPRDRVR